MKQSVYLLLGLAVLATVYFALAGDGGEATAEDSPAPAPDDRHGAAEEELAAVSPPAVPAPARSELPAEAAPERTRPAAAEPATGRWRLEVVDPEDRPLAVGSFTLEGGATLATDGDGFASVAFDPLSRETDGPTGGSTLIALGRPLGTESETDAVWVVAPTEDVRGRVVDANGVPLAGVKIAVEQGDGLCRLERVLTDTVSFPFSSTEGSGGRGEFSFESLPIHPCNRLILRLEGYASKSVPTTEVRDGRIDVELEALPPAPGASNGDGEPRSVTVRGLVLAADGRPVEGAEVVWWGRFSGIETPATDASGRFVLEVPKPPSEQAPLAVRHLDYGVVDEPDFGALVLESWPVEPQELVLRFEPEPRSIAGRIVDGNGDGIGGMTVDVFEFTSVSNGFFGTGTTLEGPSRTATDGRGEFRVTGLLDRPYTLVAFDEERMLVDRYEDVPAGTDELEWVIDRRDVHSTVEGRVTTSAGAALPGAEVRVVSTVWVVRGEGGAASTSINGDPVVCDAEGRFVLTNVPKRYASLGVNAPKGLRARPPMIPTDEIDPSEPLEIVVPLERPLRIEVVDAESGFERGEYTVVFEDAFGARHSGASYTRDGSTSSSRIALDSFASPVWWTSDEVVQARLYAGWTSEELDSAPVVFGGDGVARVRLRAR